MSAAALRRFALLGIGAIFLGSASAAFGYWTVNALSDTGSYALAHASSLSVPIAPTATANNGTAVTVAWTLPDGQLAGAQYQVTRTSPGTMAVCTVAIVATTCQDTGLTGGTAYTYSVVAILDNWQSTTASTSATTLGVITTSLPAGDAGVAYSITPAAMGGSGTYTSWALAGTLPAGLSFSTTTGRISGSPTAAATTGLVLTVTDSNGATVSSGTLSISINSAPTVTTTGLPTATDGLSYAQTLSSSGGTGAITWSISSGSLPTGLTLNTSTGVISGTAGATATAQTFTVVAADALNVASIGKTLTLSVNAAAAQPPVDLGAAAGFALLGGSGITNTGATTITGNVGSSPTPSETGFGSVALTGTNYLGNPPTPAAKADLATAYANVVARTPASPVAGPLAGTMFPGVYSSVALGVANTLTLDAQGNSNAQFIFQATSTLITAASSHVILTNGAQSCNVVWQVGSSATFTVGSQFAGTVLAETSITAQNGSTFQGRLLAIGGAVTLDTNAISNANCVAPTVTTGSLATATDGQVGYSQTLASSEGTAPITWTISSGSLPTGLTLNSSTGVISGSVGGVAVTQTFSVLATDANGLASAATPFTITVVAGAPATLALSSGSAQSTTVNTAFASPLVARVSDAFNNPLSGVTVTFTAPGAGTSGTFAGGVNTATTNASGLAASGLFTANTTSGTYNVAASATGTGGANFSETNNPGLADKLAFTTEPAGGVAEATNFATPSTVSIEDSFGNVVTTDNGTVTLAIATGPPAGTLSCVNTGFPTVSATAGAATFTSCQISGTAAAGTYTLKATRVSLITATSSTIVITPGAAARLAWSSTSSSACSPPTGTSFALNYSNCGFLLAGTTFKSKLTLTDTFANPVTNGTGSAISITVTVSGLSVGGTFTRSPTVTIPVGQSQSATGGDGSSPGTGEITYSTGLLTLGAATLTATATPAYTTATATFT